MALAGWLARTSEVVTAMSGAIGVLDISMCVSSPGARMDAAYRDLRPPPRRLDWPRGQDSERISGPRDGMTATPWPMIMPVGHARRSCPSVMPVGHPRGGRTRDTRSEDSDELDPRTPTGADGVPRLGALVAVGALRSGRRGGDHGARPPGLGAWPGIPTGCCPTSARIWPARSPGRPIRRSLSSRALRIPARRTPPRSWRGCARASTASCALAACRPRPRAHIRGRCGPTSRSRAAGATRTSMSRCASSPGVSPPSPSTSTSALRIPSRR